MTPVVRLRLSLGIIVTLLLSRVSIWTEEVRHKVGSVRCNDDTCLVDDGLYWTVRQLHVIQTNREQFAPLTDRQSTGRLSTWHPRRRSSSISLSNSVLRGKPGNRTNRPVQDSLLLFLQASVEEVRKVDSLLYVSLVLL